MGNITKFLIAGGVRCTALMHHHLTAVWPLYPLSKPHDPQLTWSWEEDEGNIC